MVELVPHSIRKYLSVTNDLQLPAELKILEDKTGLTAYEAAIYDVTDPLLPVRGHGIIELARLVDIKVRGPSMMSRMVRWPSMTSRIS